MPVNVSDPFALLPVQGERERMKVPGREDMLESI
jgi:hypothetical protein